MFAAQFDIDAPSRIVLAGSPEGHDARVVADIALRTHGAPLLVVLGDDVRAAAMAEALAFFAPHLEVINFPAWDCLPYDRVSPHPDIMGQRLSALARLLRPFAAPAVLLTTVAAVSQRVLPPHAIGDAVLDIRVGGELKVEKLRGFLSANGYVNAGTVREAGEFAVRGGIVDIFPSGHEAPARIDFFGDEVESLRLFDPLTQTTTEKTDVLLVRPISEAMLGEKAAAVFRTSYREAFGAVTDGDPLYAAVTAGRKFPGTEHWLPLFHENGLAALFDYLPRSPVVLDWQIDEALAARRQQVADFYQARVASLSVAAKDRRSASGGGAAVYKPLPPERMHIGEEEWNALLSVRAVGCLSPFAPADNDAPAAASAIDAGGVRGRDFSAARNEQEANLYAAFREYAREHQAAGRRVAIACYSNGSAERLSGMLRKHGIDSFGEARTWEEARKLDNRLIPAVILGIAHGFVAKDLAVATEQDLLGDRMIRRARPRRASSGFRLELGSLNAGDFVVHAEHGIGRYEGLEAIAALGMAHDCVKLVYDGGDRLFVPVENMEVLSRYASADSGAVLDKLGGVAWQSRKARVKKRLLDMAEVLLKIAAERQTKAGELVEAPEDAYQEFAARFPYPETEDQERAIRDVLQDLASGRPMDRLVCGDVGFGKTEVALRAAFAAVMSGLQVAVVVPTTLLARQHFRNFSQRFAGTPVRVAQLSRMVSAAETKRVRDMMKEGLVDIVVGTHALLGGDVGFARLGLMIVDEEQHFGVKQKERLKQLRADVHVLTLTATPIPRTLQLAMAGVRELSLIATPPIDRLAVRTSVLPYDPVVLREALMREHYRGGQSFYVCPRIEDLSAVAASLRDLVPEIKLTQAHGRMGAGELDDIMTAFDAGDFGILLATNIVESGLDIPNANTIVIHRADMFGLAQLYQLRGRVGRAKQRGYAYLTYAPDAPLSETAQRRLEVIQTLDQLGAGFQLASHDMDIRGAGNLLGEEQSGHIREVGIELYQQMLEDAVATARAASGKGGGEKLVGNEVDGGGERWTPQINVGLSVMIPETYVSDLNVRLGLYRRLADAADKAETESIAAEMTDRFGPLPAETENLLATVNIKQLCRRAGISRVDAGARGAVLSFHNDTFSRPDRLVAWIASQSGTAKLRPDHKLVMMRAWDDLSARIAGVERILKELAEMV